MGLPTDVRRFFGYALSLAQAGDQHDAAKVLQGFGSAGVLEVVEDDARGTYRAVYNVKVKEAGFGARRAFETRYRMTARREPPAIPVWFGLHEISDADSGIDSLIGGCDFATPEKAEGSDLANPKEGRTPFVTSAAPSVVVAPGRFSTTTGCPNRSASF